MMLMIVNLNTIIELISFMLTPCHGTKIEFDLSNRGNSFKINFPSRNVINFLTALQAFKVAEFVVGPPRQDKAHLTGILRCLSSISCFYFSVFMNPDGVHVHQHSEKE